MDFLTFFKTKNTTIVVKGRYDENDQTRRTYVDGNAAIPYSETTQAKTATEKHTIHISDTATDWKVSCVDDFGNQYTGIFPK